MYKYNKSDIYHESLSQSREIFVTNTCKYATALSSQTPDPKNTTKTSHNSMSPNPIDQIEFSPNVTEFCRHSKYKENVLK